MALLIQERVPNTVFKVCYIIKPRHKSAQCNKNSRPHTIQAVTTLVAAVQSQASPNGIYSTKSGTGTGFPLSTAGFLSYHSTDAAHSFTYQLCCIILAVCSIIMEMFTCYQNTTFYYRKIFQKDEL